MAWSLDLDEIEQYRHDGCLLVQSVLAGEDLRLLDEAAREVTEAAIGSHNQDDVIELEPDTGSSTRRVRRIRDPYDRHDAFRAVAHDARVLDRVDLTVSLYDIQADN